MKRITCTDNEVKEILDGTVTQLTRPVHSTLVMQFDPPHDEVDIAAGYPYIQNAYGDNIKGVDFCPFGRINDRVWVQESWGIEHLYPDKQALIHYKATPANKGYGRLVQLMPYMTLNIPSQSALGDADGRWRSPATMPQSISRITLRLTNVQLREISGTWCWILDFVIHELTTWVDQCVVKSEARHDR